MTPEEKRKWERDLLQERGFREAQYEQPTGRARFFSQSGWDLPDWRDASRYAWIDEACVELQRWEFTRRSLGYLLYWNRWHTSRKSGFLMRTLVDPRRSGEEAQGEIEFLDSRWQGGEAMERDLTPEAIDYARKSAVVYVMFNLAFPLHEQLERAGVRLRATKAKGHAEEEFATLVVPGKIRLPAYPSRELRAMDAWDAGITAAEIGRTVFDAKGEEASKEWLRRLAPFWRYHLLYSRQE